MGGWAQSKFQCKSAPNLLTKIERTIMFVLHRVPHNPGLRKNHLTTKAEEKYKYLFFHIRSKYNFDDVISYWLAGYFMLYHALLVCF